MSLRGKPPSMASPHSLSRLPAVTSRFAMQARASIMPPRAVIMPPRALSSCHHTSHLTSLPDRPHLRIAHPLQATHSCAACSSSGGFPSTISFTRASTKSFTRHRVTAELPLPDGLSNGRGAVRGAERMAVSQLHETKDLRLACDLRAICVRSACDLRAICVRSAYATQLVRYPKQL